MKRPKDMTDGEILALPVAAAGETFLYHTVDPRYQGDDVIHFIILDEPNLVLLNRFDQWVRLPARMARIERHYDRT